MKYKMKKTDAIAQLSKISCGDIEQAHIDADAILLIFLEDNGHQDLTNAFKEVNARCGGFWYA